MQSILEEINSGGDKIFLVGVTQELLNFESQDSDVYSDGITEVAFDFVNPLFIQVPMVMDFVKLTICNNPPPHLVSYADDGVVFAFFEIDYQSTGGQIVHRAFIDGTSQVDNAEKIETIIGYVVAEKIVIRNNRLISGNCLRKDIVSTKDGI